MYPTAVRGLTAMFASNTSTSPTNSRWKNERGGVMSKRVLTCPDCSELFIDYNGKIRCPECRMKRRPYVQSRKQAHLQEAPRRGTNNRVNGRLNYPPDTYLPALLGGNFQARVQTGNGGRAKNYSPFSLDRSKVIRSEEHTSELQS